MGDRWDEGDAWAQLAAAEAALAAERERSGALAEALTDLLGDRVHRRHAVRVMSCAACGQHWPCPAERARLALAAEVQP